MHLTTKCNMIYQILGQCAALEVLETPSCLRSGESDPVRGDVKHNNTRSVFV